jgi:hypothetical protein
VNKSAKVVLVSPATIAASTNRRAAEFAFIGTPGLNNSIGEGSTIGSGGSILPVFEGRRRYDLRFGDLNSAVQAVRAGEFDGPIRACTMRDRRLRGCRRRAEGA